MTIKLRNQIAQVCHDANASYCWSIGDHTQRRWDEAEEWQRSSAIRGVMFHWERLMEGKQPIASASHEAWMADKLENGWAWGEVKDAALRTHPCIVPYEQLPIEQRLKDYIFAAIVKAFWEAQGEPEPDALLAPSDPSEGPGESPTEAKGEEA